MLKAVLFDLDNTLIENIYCLSKTFAELYENYLVDSGLDYSNTEKSFMWHFRAGQPGFKVCYDGFNAETAIENFISYENFCKFWLEVYPTKATLFPETLEVLKTIRDMGYKLGIITNGPQHMQRTKLKASGLEDMFDVIVVSGEVEVHKPNKEIFEIALSKLGLSADQCVYVGDQSETDIKGSKNAQMISIIREGYCDVEITKADYRIKTLSELPQILEKL